MAALVINGITYNKGTIAIMKQRQMDAEKIAKAPTYKGMANGKSAVKSTKISHEQRKARIVARSIENDPKNSANKSKRK